MHREGHPFAHHQWRRCRYQPPAQPPLPRRRSARRPQPRRNLVHQRVRPHRRGTTPVHRSGGRRGISLHPLRALRRAPLAALFRPARHQSVARPQRDRAIRVGGGCQLSRHLLHRRRRRSHDAPVHGNAAHLHLSLRLHRRTIQALRRHLVGRRRRDLARRALPRVHRSLLRPGRVLPGHPRRAHLLLGVLRLSLSVRQVRPGLRARVQHGRDGERRLHHLLRADDLPRPADRDSAPQPRRSGPPRDGAHVVRRPRHDALVERSVAERVVRDLHGLPGDGTRDPLVGERLVSVPRADEGLGLRAGPAPHDAPHRRRRARHGRHIPQLRWHHLRQGRGRAQAARRIPRRGRLPRRHARLLPHPCLGQHHARRLPRRARARLRARARTLVGGLARNCRRQHPGPAVGHRRRNRQLLQHRTDRHRRASDAASAPYGDRGLRPL